MSRHRLLKAVRFCLLLSFILTCVPVCALATEYWQGYDDRGESVEVIVRYGEGLHQGADVFLRDRGTSTQTEGTVTAVLENDGQSVRVEIVAGGIQRTCVLRR